MGYNAPKQTVSQFQLKGRYARQYLSFYTYENDYFCDCWLRYYIGVSREVPADTVRAHINNNMMF